MTIPKYVENSIKAHVLADLQPSKWMVLLKATAASLLGGFLSLFFCGQFGISIGEWAFDFSQHLPMEMTPLNCALMCGVVFSVVPVFLMRFAFFNTLQFRAVIQRYIFWITIPYLLWLPIFASKGSFSEMEVELGLWALTAFFSTLVIGQALRRIGPNYLFFRKGLSL